MKNNGNSVVVLIVKIVVALLAVAGAVYVIVAFGDKIVAWVKNLASKLPCFKSAGKDCDCIDEEDDCDAASGDALVAEENEFEN